MKFLGGGFGLSLPLPDMTWIFVLTKDLLTSSSEIHQTIRIARYLPIEITARRRCGGCHLKKNKT